MGNGDRDRGEYTDDPGFGGVTYGRRWEGPQRPNPQDEVWRSSDPYHRHYGVVTSWLGGRGDPEEEEFTARDYYGETFRGWYPPERHRYDGDRYAENRWARENPHGSAGGYHVDPERPAYRRWREVPRAVGPVRPRPGEHSGKGPRALGRDARIRDRVCERLEDDGIVDASDIEVDCEDGTVTLTGTVADRQQKRWAERIADAVPGVRDVVNRLRLAKPGTDTGPAGH